MAPKTHEYAVHVRWTGNTGQGTSGYRIYSRDHELSADEKPPVPGSSDPAFRGDPTRYNPEELLVGSLSACHMLWYLHLCAVAGIVVTEYIDDAIGKMEQTADGGGRFTSVVLRPAITVEPGADLSRAEALHEQAHGLCFIARSVNFAVLCEPRIRVGY
jgi:organic hydroperoxide reductase OsmC/OhrA